MSREILIGIIASGVLHAGLFLSGLWSGEHEAVTPRPEPEVVEPFVLPPVEPDDPEPVAATDEPAPREPLELVPQQPDRVTVVVGAELSQRLQSPPPPTLSPTHGPVTIPVHRGTPSLDGAASRIFDLAHLDQQPSPSFQPRPVYPFEMRRTGVDGEVVVAFVVDAQGRVRDAHVVSSTQREFEPAALQAVSKWRFKPGRKGNRDVSTRLRIPIRFSIEND